MENPIPLKNDADPGNEIPFGKLPLHRLVNLLNYVNFEERHLHVVLSHKRYGYQITLRAKPGPCSGGKVTCTWFDRVAETRLGSYEFSHFLVDSRKDLYLVRPVVEKLSPKGLTFDITSAQSYKVGYRKARRVACVDIEAQLIQSGICLTGRLVDHSTFSFSVRVQPLQTGLLKLVNHEKPLTAVLKNGARIVFSGECEVLRSTRNRHHSFLILKPLHEKISRFKPKKFRSERVVLSPPPAVYLKSPLTDEEIHLSVEDLSGTGFSVEESLEKSVLFPGLIIPRLVIVFSSQSSITCSAQVVCREAPRIGNPSEHVRFGFAFLDMEMDDQLVLSSILHGRRYSNAYVCSRINPDDLWGFFFDSGFVYPEKYLDIHERKKLFKKTYEKLYRSSNDIARYFTYQEKGAIHSHLSMIRFYEKAWLIQHHIAKSSSLRKVGVQVLDQVGSYINDFHSLSSTNMEYVMCYYRPNNRFPNRIFGGCAESIGEKKACSIDSFAYTLLESQGEGHGKLPALLEVAESSSDDLDEFGMFYEHASGGLMVNALKLQPSENEDNLSEDYERLGFKRERRIFSLYKKGLLKGLLVVNVSDLGLNLSNLTNCIHAFVMDPDELSGGEIEAACRHLFTFYEKQENVPVLIYPSRVAEEKAIPFKRIYNLWILSMEHTERYFAFLDTLFGKPERRKILRPVHEC